VIKAIMLKGLSREVITNPIKLKDFLQAATDNLTVDQNLDVGAMRSEAVAMRNLRGSDIRFVTAPFSGFGTSPEGGSIDIVDQGRMSDLGKAIREDALESYQ
jgi:anionic cell wall polymer biosynthesis LytR-Cps2A-Psr (LCP) family protein